MAAIIGTSFGLALCKHFNLPADQVSTGVVVNNKQDEVFGVTLTIALTGDDVMRIGRIMKERCEALGCKAKTEAMDRVGEVF